MNILNRELKAGLKVFLYWSLGLFALVFMGMIKFTGLQGAGAAEITELFDKFPKIVLAVFGMVNIDVTTLGGYYAILSYYSLICVAIYGVALGINAVNRETVDKTYEFLFTKPRSRSYILSFKLLTGVIFLSGFSILNFIFSILSIATLKVDETITTEIVLYTAVIFIIGMLFYSLSAYIATVLKQTEKSSLYGNLLFLGAFLTSFIYDLLDKPGLFKLVAPLKYFEGKDLINNSLDTTYLIISVIVITLVTFETFRKFSKKEFII